MFKIVNGVKVALTQTEIDIKATEEVAYLAEEANYVATVKYKDDRKREYPNTEELIIAMWESLEENNNIPMNELQARRVVTKLKYPAPIK